MSFFPKLSFLQKLLFASPYLLHFKRSRQLEQSGAFDKIILEQRQLLQSQYLYFQVNSLNEYKKTQSKLFNDSTVTFNPRSMLQINIKSESNNIPPRSYSGILLDLDQREQIEKFKQRHPEFKSKHLPSTTILVNNDQKPTEIVAQRLPFKIIPAIKQYMEENNTGKIGNCTLSLYPVSMPSEKNKNYQYWIAFPLNASEFDLTKENSNQQKAI